MNDLKKEIRTKLKFVESEKTGEMIGFITKDKATGRLRGVRESEDVKKKIVLIAKEIAPTVDVKKNILYDVVIKPMKEDRGYLVTSLSIVEFEADLVTRDNTVLIGFGNKIVTYDPSQPDQKSKGTIEGVTEILRNRIDIKDKELVIANFEERAKELSFKILGAVHGKSKCS